MAQEEQDEINKLLEEGGKYYANEDYEKAIECCDKIIAINPNIAEVYINKGLALNQLAKYQEAIDAFGKSFDLYTDSNDKAKTQFYKGNALDGLNQYQEAIIAFDKAFDLYSDNNNKAKTLLNKGVALKKLNKYQEAIIAYDKAFTLYTNNNGKAKTQFNKGNTLIELEQYQEAIIAFDKAFDLYSDNNDKAKTQFNKGNALNKHNQYQEAIITFDKAFNLFTDNNDKADAQFNKGLTHILLNEWKKAGESLGKGKADLLQIGLILINTETSKENIQTVTNNLLKHQPENYFWKVLERTGICKAPDRPCKQHSESCEGCKLKNECHAYMQIYVQSLQIISLLRVNNDVENQVAHYTSKEAARLMLIGEIDNSKQGENMKAPTRLRLNSIARANDPKEGQTLSDYLFDNQTPIKNTKRDKDKDYQAFISCFTFNHESLNQFRLYGKEDGVEASGVSIVLNRDFFNEKTELAKYMSSTDETKIEDSNPKAKDKKLSLFRCIYIDPETEAVVSLGHKELYAYIREEKDKNKPMRVASLIKKYKKEYINQYISKQQNRVTQGLKELKKLTADKNLDPFTIDELLLMLSYLVKHVAFKEEQECRILEIASLSHSENPDEKGTRKLNTIATYNSYRMYMDYLPLTGYVDRIHVGPQFKNFGLFRDIIKHKCGIDSYLCNHPFAIT